ncbi:branched-chain amino acid ABC transporter permease [Roseomonas sp. KE2513]|uniref:branched-chain amino acid ABC transporter permease n=1 Tax=Roseomonas sp. KE2513 TaxID=2479202 RepID=UPI0018DF3659|nr:branched-chain amino acid ABC transporter permease [Roseomonas sp. KE2513]MBI0538998.1 branched-chain amino acid ABC transporter permease [Roseomonas sp. KE2513]
MDLELLIDALVAGLLLGGFYGALSLGLAIAFGLLDVPHIAHPAFALLGAYGAVLMQGWFGLDPVLSGLILALPFYALGVAVYSFYHTTFERRGTDAGLRGLAFFFGVAFVAEVILILLFGIDQRGVRAPYIGRALVLGEFRLPWRMLVASGVALAIAGAMALWLSRTYVGRAVQAVAQDATALSLLGADPVRVKRIGFGIATASVALSGALLVVVGPVEPGLARIYIGKVFAIVVLAGLGSVGGTVLAALLLGVIESVMLSSPVASWTPAVAFGLLLAVLGLRPQGLFGR